MKSEMPPYSPDYNLIEKAFSKVKEILRRAEARTRKALIEAMGRALPAVTVRDARGFFTHCATVCRANCCDGRFLKDEHTPEVHERRRRRDGRAYTSHPTQADQPPCPSQNTMRLSRGADFSPVVCLALLCRQWVPLCGRTD